MTPIEPKLDVKKVETFSKDCEATLKTKIDHISISMEEMKAMINEMSSTILGKKPM